MRTNNFIKQTILNVQFLLTLQVKQILEWYAYKIFFYES